MKRLTKYSCLLGAFSILMISCSSNSSSESNTNSLGVKLEGAEITVDEKREVLVVNPVFQEDTISGVIDDVEAVAPVKKKVTRDECNAVYLQYESLVEKFLLSASDKDANLLFDFTDEVLYIKCRENPAYVKVFNELEKKLE